MMAARSPSLNKSLPENAANQLVLVDEPVTPAEVTSLMKVQEPQTLKVNFLVISQIKLPTTVSLLNVLD